MLLLIVLILIGAAVTYGIFFLLFKLVWKLLKKDSNKGPLILSGIFTAAVWAVIVGVIYWTASMILSPLQTMIQDVKQNPQPVYGQRVYQDSTYPVALTVFDGMQFSDWITTNKFTFKLGMDTNLFKKGQKKGSPFMVAIIARDATPNKGAEQVFSSLREAIRAAEEKRRFMPVQQQAMELDGKPAYFVSGVLASNNSLANVAGVALYAGPEEVYFIGGVDNDETDLPRLVQMVQSARVTR